MNLRAQLLSCPRAFDLIKPEHFATERDYMTAVQQTTIWKTGNVTQLSFGKDHGFSWRTIPAPQSRVCVTLPGLPCLTLARALPEASAEYIARELNAWLAASRANPATPVPFPYPSEPSFCSAARLALASPDSLFSAIHTTKSDSETS